VVAKTKAAHRDAGELRAAEGVEGNARLTGATAAVLFVLFAAEGVTILSIHTLVTPHVFIGLLMVPPVLVKIGSTSWRIGRFYLGSPAYRQKGAPPTLLRLLGPVVVVLTAVVLGSGVALLFVGRSLEPDVMFVHKASFVLWFGSMAIHVLAHIVETAELAPRDWYARTRKDARGASARQWLLAVSLVAGVFLGILLIDRVGPFVASWPRG